MSGRPALLVAAWLLALLSLAAAADGRLAAPNVLTVRQALALCRDRLHGSYRLQVHALLLLEVSETYGGGLFDTREVPLNAAAMPDHYGDLAEGFNTPPAGPVPPPPGAPVATPQGGIPGSGTWIVARGVLHCFLPPNPGGGRQPPHAFVIDSWSPAAPEPAPRLPALGRLLVPSSAHRFCRSHPTGRYQVSVRGYFSLVNAQFTYGWLYGVAVPGATGPDPFSGDHPLVVTTSVRAGAGSGPNARPQGNGWYTIHGLLVCSLRPIELEAYSFRPMPGAPPP